MRPLLFDLGVSKSMREGLLEACAAEPGTLEKRNFPDGETYIRILSDCAGRHAIVACGLADPDRKVLPLLFVAEELREQGAAAVGLVAPYLAYMRQDRRFNPGEAVTSRYFARIVSAHFDWLATVDPHLHRFAALGEIYGVPTRVAEAAPDIATWLCANVDKPLLIGPDSESAQWVSVVAAQAGAPGVVLEKIRKGDRDVRISIPRLGDYLHHTPVLVDDIVSTGRTMMETLRHLAHAGMPSAVCIGVHALFVGDAYGALRAAGAERIISCNTVAHETNSIDVSHGLGQAAAGLID
jgi:ribose-phosphate pyrophosphokinase